ncbi:MAG TPA: lytic transglycosylase domain-containing protein [Burkholderiales bacterium]|jgi:soluble lytic murein transglycosylase-like protein|nr:lytic transglycosylase domain-containing protein [Burkholderiales bacterium]
MTLTYRIRLTLCAGLAAFLSSPASADIYRYVDQDGHVHYTNVPPDSRFKLYMKIVSDPDPMRETLASEVRHYGPQQRSRYDKHIRAAAKANRLDPALLHAVISAESGYNPFARSRKGATGLMQLMPDTARRYGVKNLLDPVQNIHAGARYLRDLMDLFNSDLQLVLAAYNAGENAVLRAGMKIPPYSETMTYVPRVITYYRQYRTRS